MANSVVPEEAAAWILYLLSTLWSKRLLSTLHQVLLVATTLSGTDKTFLTDVLLTVNLGEADSKQIKQKPTVCQPFRTEVGNEKKWGVCISGEAPGLLEEGNSSSQRGHGQGPKGRSCPQCWRQEGCVVPAVG